MMLVQCMQLLICKFIIFKIKIKYINSNNNNYYYYNQDSRVQNQ